MAHRVEYVGPPTDILTERRMAGIGEQPFPIRFGTPSGRSDYPGQSVINVS
jgi:hypothetical protein